VSVEGTLSSHQTNKLILQRSGNIGAVRAYGAGAGDGIFDINVGGGGGGADQQAATFQATQIVMNDIGADRDFRVESDTNANMLFVDGGADKVGIGKTPSYTLDVDGPARLGNVSTVSGSKNLALYYDDGDIATLGGYYGSGGLVLGYGVWPKNGNVGYVSSSALTLERQSIHLSGNVLELHGGSSQTVAIDGDVTMTKHATLGATTGYVFNEAGADIDFRVESDTNTHALFVDGGNDQVVIGSSTPITGSASNIPLAVGYSTGPAVRFYSNVSASRIATAGISLTTYGADKYSGYQLAANGVGMWTTSSSATANYVTGGAGSGPIYLGNFSQDPFENTSVAFVEYANFNNTEIVFNETSLDRDFRVESDSNSSAFFVDAAEDNVLMGRTSAQSYENTASEINVEATGSFSTSAVVQTGVGTTYVDSGWTFGNTSQVWLITLVGNNSTSNAYSTVAYIATVGAFSKTLVQLGNASDHFGNGYLSAQLDSSSASTVNLQVRWNSLYSGGTSNVTVQGLRLL
jgi:hypothetical protein